MFDVALYTDGACSGNPGPGGWAFLLRFGEHEKSGSGYVENTTNNRMELTAVIEGLRHLKSGNKVLIHTDSAYILNAYKQGWIENWKANNWTRGPKKEPVKNRDLWEQLDSLQNRFDITWVKVAAHSGNTHNERVDKMAVEEYKKRMTAKKEQTKDGRKR
jgi:ribonuclease HI